MTLIKMTLIKEYIGNFKFCELIEIGKKQTTRVLIYKDGTAVVKVLNEKMTQREINMLIIKHYWKIYNNERVKLGIIVGA